jgi:hypothetical protein
MLSQAQAIALTACLIRCDLGQRRFIIHLRSGSGPRTEMRPLRKIVDSESRIRDSGQGKALRAGRAKDFKDRMGLSYPIGCLLSIDRAFLLGVQVLASIQQISALHAKE